MAAPARRRPAVVVEAWAAALAGQLKAALEQVLGVTMLTPRDPESSTGVVTAGLAGWAGRELIDTLRRRWRVTGRSAYGDRAARFALACFIAEAVVETRSEAMRKLARSPRPAPAPGAS